MGFINQFKSKKAVILLAGSAVAQLVVLGGSPILTRLFNPHQIGEYGILIAWFAILSTVTMMRFEMFIVPPKYLGSSINLTVLSIGIAVILSFFVLIFNLIFFLIFSDYSFNFVLLGFMLFLGAVGTASRMLVLRLDCYKQVAIGRLIQAGTTVTSQISFGVLAPSSFFLVCGQLIGQACLSLYLVYQLSTFKYVSFNKVSLKRLHTVARRHLKTVLFAMPAILCSRVAQESFILLTAYVFGQYYVGLLVVLIRVIGTPTALFSQSFGDLFYRHISQLSGTEAYRVLCQYVVILSLISAAGFGVYYFFLQKFFVIIFGAHWSEALAYMPFLILLTMFSFVFSPLSQIFNIIGRQDVNLIWQLCWLFSNIFIFWFGMFLELEFVSVLGWYVAKQCFL